MHAVRTIVVDLDLEPEQRWNHAVEEFREELIGVMTSWWPRLNKGLPELSKAEWLENHNFSEEDLRELLGIVAAAGHPEVTLERLILYNLLYELHFPTFCSGTITALPDGTVLHVRNMDYSLSFHAGDRTLGLTDITFDADFQRGGKTLFTSAHWIGHLGIHTAMRPGGWSFEQNTRHTNSQPGNLVEARKGGLTFMLEARRTMEEVSSFDEAVQRLAGAHLMAPMYFVIAGTKAYEGAVITRDRGAFFPPYDNVEVLSPKKWFMVQTNDDRSGSPADPRRPFAEQMLRAVGQESISQASVTRTMRTFPLYRPITVFTWITIPATGFHKTVLQGESLGKTVLVLLAKANVTKARR